jgi:transketolase
VLLSDGEHDEGQLWEAVMFASKYRLRNLTAWVDRNNIQIDGVTEDVMPLEPFAAKYAAFGWHVLQIDGHNYRAIVDAARFAEAVYDRPTVVICQTIPGKGVDHARRLHLARHPTEPRAGQAGAGRAAQPARAHRR